MPYKFADGRTYSIFSNTPDDPTPVEDAGKLYCKLNAGLEELFWMRSDGSISQITLASGTYSSDDIANDSVWPGATVTDALDAIDGSVTGLNGNITDINTTLNTLNASIEDLQYPGIVDLNGEGPHSLEAGYVNQVIRVTHTDPCSIFVPSNTTDPTISLRSQFLIGQWGAGLLSLTPDTGVNIRVFGGSLDFAGQYAAARLIKVAANEWWLLPF